LPTPSKNPTTSDQTEYLEKKIVYTADVYTQTKNMTEARQTIENMIKEMEAYISGESTSTNGSIDSNYRSKTTNLTIRIPSENFHAFLNGLESDNIFVESMNKNSTDYSNQYYDKQSRIESLEIQQERLLEMLKQANTVQTMLDIESRLSNVRYEIESLTKELKYIEDQEYQNLSKEIISIRKMIIKYQSELN
jgi:hypothetical protein